MSFYVPTGTPPYVAGSLARIERRLPQAGEVLVRVGQRVEPEDPVARTYLSGTPQIINVARALMIAPSQVGQALRREVGNKVAQGEVLARTGRIGGRTCLASVSGVIAAIDTETGYVTISPDPQVFEIQATVRGIVMEVFAREGVRIETPAAQVYGAVGVGRERSGVLQLLVTDPSEPIVPDMITAKSAYSILIGGGGITAAALRRAVKEQVRGVIVGGIDELELRAFLETGRDSWRLGGHGWQLLHLPTEHDQLTVVVTEGFGTRPMAAPIFELLAEHDRQEALIAGITRLRLPQQRPQVVIPLSARNSAVTMEAPRPALRPGATVRLLDAEHLGQIARVRAVSAVPRRLASRVRAQAVEVVTDTGAAVLPRAAIEVLS